MEPITLLFTLDANYLPQLHVLLTSIRLNNPGETFRIFLMHRGLTQSELLQAARRCDAYGWTFVPVRVEEALFAEAPTTAQYPQEMYYRMLAAQLLPPTLSRVIYLDPDTLVINPLRPLWETDLDGRLFAACAHTGKTEIVSSVNRVRLNVTHDYFNSGVLLMDLTACRREIRPEALFAFVREHASTLLLPDQDLLNSLYGSRVLPLEDVIWNYDARDYLGYQLVSGGRVDLDWIMAHTAILHFCGRAKPWRPDYRYRFGLLYKHYQQLTRHEMARALGQ